MRKYKAAFMSLNYNKIQKLEEEIATLYHKKLISKKLETVEMSLTSVVGAIFETEEEEEESEYTTSRPKMSTAINNDIRQICWGCQNDAPGLMC